MKVLIVDDKLEKMGEIRSVVVATGFIDPENIHTSVDLFDATRRLRTSNYDFVIIDLNIANNVGEDADMNMGMRLINTILGQNRIRKPHTIIVLSEYQESIDKYDSTDDSYFEAILFNSQDISWRNTLTKRLNACYSYTSGNNYNREIDVAFITAVDVEFNAVYNEFSGWNTIDYPDVNTIFYTVNYEMDHTKYRIVLVKIPEMGIGAAAVGTSTVLRYYNPKYIVMTGIVGGIDANDNYGDIVIPEEVWNYSSGKFKVNQDNNIVLIPDNNSLRTSTRIVKQIHDSNYDSVLAKISDNYSGIKPDTQLRIVKGKIACGSSVVTTRRIVDDQILNHVRKTSAIDMESYGVLLAANQVSEPPRIIIAKSISDFADENKDDSFQEYAAYTSIALIKELFPKLFDDFQ